MAARTVHCVTPLIRSEPLTAALGTGHTVLLKLDALQPTGSFKLRGIGAAVSAAKASGATSVISSSGGNAGFATAYAARAVGLAAEVVLPESTPASAAERLRSLGAKSVFRGAVWDEANAHALGLVESAADAGRRAVLIHPFEGTHTWDGHATLVAEIAEQLATAMFESEGPAPPPACVVTVCGGGGLMLGIVRGLAAQARRDASWEGVRVLACETYGADSLAQSLAAGELVTLPGITSVAKSLGAATVSARALEAAMDDGVDSAVCTDASAVRACIRFADDHRLLVEPACGAGLAAVYERAPSLLEACARVPHTRPVVVEVCGGALVDRASLATWASDLDVD